jgi:hypothetical protein
VITGSDKYTTKVTNQYGFGRLDSQPFSKLRLAGTFLWNPVITRGLLPFNTISFGGTDPAVNFGGNIGLLGEVHCEDSRADATTQIASPAPQPLRRPITLSPVSVGREVS